MATDYDSGLPIRSESDGADERVHCKWVDYTDPGGTDKQVQVSNKNAHMVAHGVYNVTTNPDPSTMSVIGHVRNATPDATHQTVRWTGAAPSSDNIDPTTVRAMDVNSYLLGYDTVGGQWDRVTISNGDLNVNIDQTVDVDVDGVYNVSTNADPDNIGLIIHTRATTPGDSDQVKRVTGIQGTDDDTIHAMDVALHDSSGDAYTVSNPLPVTYTDEAGDDVHDPDESAAAVAKDATDNHDYTVTAGKTLRLKKIQAAGSGKIRAELFIETAASSGTFVSNGVWFNSTANPNISERFIQPIEVATGVIVRIAITNLDNQPQSVYSFINGSEY